MAVQKLKAFQGGITPLDDGMILPYLRDFYESGGSFDPDLPTADNTRLRGSQALDCARQIAFKVLKVPEPLHMAGETLMMFDVGHEIHHRIQDVMVKELGGEAEVKVSYAEEGIELSGHVDMVYNSLHVPTYTVGSDDVTPRAYCAVCSAALDDLVVRWPCAPSQSPDTLGEIKSISGYGFMVVTGARKSDEGPGPKDGDVCQAAIYANSPQLRNKIKQLHMIYVDRDKMVIAEFILNMDEPLPRYGGLSPRQMAEAELKRMTGILRVVDGGQLPKRTIPGFGLVLDPPSAGSSGLPWQCRYCRHQPICETMAPERVDIGEYRAEE